MSLFLDQEGIISSSLIAFELDVATTNGDPGDDDALDDNDELDDNDAFDNDDGADTNNEDDDAAALPFGLAFAAALPLGLALVLGFAAALPFGLAFVFPLRVGIIHYDNIII